MEREPLFNFVDCEADLQQGRKLAPKPLKNRSFSES